jgi:hypothetical protein
MCPITAIGWYIPLTEGGLVLLEPYLFVTLVLGFPVESKESNLEYNTRCVGVSF